MSRSNKYAFPLVFEAPDILDNSLAISQGMLIREYAAIAAMQGLLAGGFDVHDGSLFEHAVTKADKLLEELNG